MAFDFVFVSESKIDAMAVVDVSRREEDKDSVRWKRKQGGHSKR